MKNQPCESCGLTGDWQPLGQFDYLCPACGGKMSKVNKPKEQTETPTPRTDVVLTADLGKPLYEAFTNLSKHAKALEREVTQALKERDEARAAGRVLADECDSLFKQGEKAEQERDSALQQVARMREPFEEAFQLIFEAYSRPRDTFSTDESWMLWQHKKVMNAITPMQKVRTALSLQPTGEEVTPAPWAMFNRPIED